MVSQVLCHYCAEQYIAAAKEASHMLERKPGIGAIANPKQRSWFCPEHGGYSIQIVLRRDA